ncbi:MAG: S49 family peptidase [Aliidongia sp.]
MQELRDAIKAFRAKGKFAYAFGETFGEISGGTRSYYLASAFDQIWLQPTGSLGLVGLHAEIPFFKGTLDKIGVEAQFGRRAEFKSAATQFTETKLPATDHEAEDTMLSSLYDQIAAGIGEGRNLQPDAVKQLIDGGPYTNQAAQDKHLIDKVGLSRRGRGRRARQGRQRRQPDGCRQLYRRVPGRPDRDRRDCANPRRRHDHLGQQQRQSARQRQCGSCRHHGAGARRGDEGCPGQGNRPAHRQPRRLGHGLGIDLARGQARPGGA